MPRLIDLSHPLVHGQPNFPADPKISVVAHTSVATTGYNLAQICMSTHQGTHLDVPFHFYENGKTLDQVPLERFYGPAVLIDLAPGGSLPPKSPIGVEMLDRHRETFQPGARVVFRTGWDRRFGSPEYFSDYPTMTIEAAHWIAGKRIGLLGMDLPTPSIHSKDVHWALLAKEVEIIIVEGLTNLDRLPARFVLAAFPLNIQGRDGSPIRAVAIVD